MDSSGVNQLEVVPTDPRQPNRPGPRSGSTRRRSALSPTRSVAAGLLSVPLRHPVPLGESHPRMSVGYNNPRFQRPYSDSTRRASDPQRGLCADAQLEPPSTETRSHRVGTWTASGRLIERGPIPRRDEGLGEASSLNLILEGFPLRLESHAECRLPANVSIAHLIDLEDLGTALVKRDAIGKLVSALIGGREGVLLDQELCRVVRRAVKCMGALVVSDRWPTRSRGRSPRRLLGCRVHQRIECGNPERRGRGRCHRYADAGVAPGENSLGRG